MRRALRLAAWSCAAAAAAAQGVATRPARLLEGHLRAGSAAVALAAPPGHSFDAPALRHALGELFSPGPRTGPCSSGAAACGGAELHFAARARALLQDAAVICECSPPPCSAASCPTAVITLAADPLYDIATAEDVAVQVPGYAVAGGAYPAGSLPLGGFAVHPEPGTLWLLHPVSGQLTKSFQVSGGAFASGGFVVTAVLQGENWLPPFALDAVTTNATAEREPRGFAAHRAAMLPAAKFGPPNRLRLPVGRLPSYRTAAGAEDITICADSCQRGALLQSGLPLAGGGVSVRVGPPWPQGCAPPRSWDCNDCINGHFGADCEQCPGDGEVCSGHGVCNARKAPAAVCVAPGWCPESRCDDGCAAGLGGVGSCLCMPGWEGAACQTRMAIATAGTVASSAATGSLFLEMAAGGSPAAPLTGITQMQLVVLLGLQTCAPSTLRGLASGHTWIVNPLYGDIRSGDGPFPEDAEHLRQTAVYVLSIFTLHLVAIAVVFWWKRDQGCTVSDAQEAVFFPAIQVLSVGILATSAVSTSAAVLSRPSDHDLTVVAGATLMCILFLVCVPCCLVYFYVYMLRACGGPEGGDTAQRAGRCCNAPDGPMRAAFLSRNVANSRANAVRVIYTTERAARMPRLLVYFLPVGFWTSLHLPQRGFWARYGIVFDEYHEDVVCFLIVQYIKIVSYAAALGVREHPWQCPRKAAAVLGIALIFAVCVTWAQPYSSLGSNMLQSLVAWCNVCVTITILIHESDAADISEQYGHLFLLVNTFLMILLALWNMAMFVLGRTVYKVKHVAAGGAGEAQAETTGPGSEPAHFTPTEGEDLSEALGCCTVHVGLADLALPHRTLPARWLELRGENLLYFASPDDAERPEGWIAVPRCALSRDANRVSLSAAGEEHVIVCESNPAAEDWASAMSALARSSNAGSAACSGPEFSDSTLDSYVELEVLGQGSYGEVRRVRCKGSGRELAMKKLRVTGAERDSVLNEVAILQLLRHPNVVRLEDAFREGTQVFLVMQLLPGGDLAHHIAGSGRLPQPAVRYFAGQVLLALAHLHANSVLYRDLKPANIVLDARGDAVLTDMGVAKKGLSAGDFCGTPYYLAPEVVQYSAYTDAVDWWAFGVVLFEMLVGVTPFAGADMPATFQRIQHEEPGFPAHVSDSARALITCLLRKRPSDRLAQPRLVQRHDFFRGLSWDKLEDRELEPPRMRPLEHHAVPAAADSPWKEEMQELNPIEATFGRRGTAASAGCSAALLPPQ
eukprot:TRINITY_DN17662_c0_g1_i1.p1 TRINITY_DN17662_c0_g1~~TRINITY_DN17662_c0_g1_i1.p1  ORF type:complete len:1268 (+),score=335.37 TRINITY_DN17662_c0_g1_i1:55-3804(+)